MVHSWGNSLLEELGCLKQWATLKFEAVPIFLYPRPYEVIFTVVKERTQSRINGSFIVCQSKLQSFSNTKSHSPTVSKTTETKKKVVILVGATEIQSSALHHEIFFLSRRPNRRPTITAITDHLDKFPVETK